MRNPNQANQKLRSTPRSTETVVPTHIHYPLHTSTLALMCSTLSICGLAWHQTEMGRQQHGSMTLLTSRTSIRDPAQQLGGHCKPV